MTSGSPTGNDFFGWIGYILVNNWVDILKGAGLTLLIALVGTIIGCLIGFLVGIVQTTPAPKNAFLKGLVSFVKLLLNVYVEIFRGTPMLVQAMFIYFGLMFAGINIGMMTAAFLIVSINTGAYMAETVRGGILSIDPGQNEGGKAIGMTHLQLMLYVILPQAFRNILPQITNNFIINIKDTCVLSVIGTIELFFVSKSIAGSLYVYFPTYTITMVVYLIMTVTSSRLLRLLEKKLDGPDSYDLATTDTLAHTSGTYKFHEKEGARR